MKTSRLISICTCAILLATATGCSSSSSVAYESSSEASEESDLSYNLDKEIKFGDISFSIDSSWKETKTDNSLIYTVSDKINLYATKSSFNGSESDCFNSRSKAINNYETNTISYETVSNNNVMLFSFEPDPFSEEDVFSRHLLTVSGKNSYEIFAESESDSWNDCNRIVFDIFKTLKMKRKDTVTPLTTVPITTEENAEETTEAPTTKSKKDENLVVYDEKGLKVIYTGCDKGILSTKFNFLLLNSSNSSYTVMSKDESINDSMVSMFFYETIAPGKKSAESMTVYGSDLKENNIDDIEKLEFKIHCYDSDDYMESFDSGVITINNP